MRILLIKYLRNIRTVFGTKNNPNGYFFLNFIKNQ
jgi:hypothetical protein